MEDHRTVYEIIVIKRDILGLVIPKSKNIVVTKLMLDCVKDKREILGMEVERVIQDIEYDSNKDD